MPLATAAPHALPPQVIKANDDLTPEHHQFFLYQMLRGLKYIHSGGVVPGRQQSGPTGCTTAARAAWTCSGS
jgi:hypothetical protein